MSILKNQLEIEITNYILYIQGTQNPPANGFLYWFSGLNSQAFF